MGQDHVVKALTHALDHDRLHHAYLFTGTRGVGKTTIARILASCLNCETNGVSSAPCGECGACQEIRDNRFVDLIEVDAASRTGVADTRELLENAQYMPTRGRYKVYLIDEVHMLSNAAFNALLKTLEEPPPHVIFLLATTEAKKVPVTVLSRCLQFQLKNISAADIQSYLAGVLTAENVDHEADALTTIARSARGSMRDALSITDQAIAFGQGALQADAVSEMLGVVGRDEVAGLLDALRGGHAETVMRVTAEFADRAVDFSALLTDLLAELHRLAVEAALSNSDAAGGFSSEALHLYYQIALIGFRDLQIAPDPRAGAEMTLLRMLAFSPNERSDVPSASGGEGAGESSSSPSKTSSKASSGDAPASAAGATGLARVEPPLSPAPQRQAKPAPEPQIEAVAAVAAASPVQPIARARLPDTMAHWYDWVDAAPVQGVAKMLLDHSVLEKEAGDELVVVLDDRHDTLLNDAQLRTMEEALSEVLGRSIRLSLQTGAPSFETPAERNQRLKEERQQEAEEAIHSDETVQALLRDFGGQVQRVQPVETPDASSGAKT